MSNLKSKIIRVSPTGDNLSIFQVSLGGDSHICNVKAVSLLSVIIRNDEYNINSKNNVLEYLYNGVPTTMSVPVGQYEIDDLFTEMKTQDPNLTFALTANASLVRISAPVNIQITGGSMAGILGFTSLPSSTGLIITANVIPDLNGLEAVFISSEKLSGHNLLPNDNKSHNTFGVISVDSVFGSYVKQNFDQANSFEMSSSMIYHNPRNLSSFDIRLLDKDDKPIEFQTPPILLFKVFY